MNRPLLPQEPATVSAQQAVLTARFLTPAQEAVAASFRDLRAAVDRDLAPGLAPQLGVPYPYGRCHDITMAVAERLRLRLERPDDDGLRAVRSFLASGGVGRIIWGALRGLYLQNAIQLGGMYVDVSNDTVDVAKPKVEILPLEQSGFEALRGPEHLADIIRHYWKARVYANHALPSLAPLLPMISIRDGERPQLQSAADYMTEMHRRDDFLRAEAWLADGPPPPDDVVAAIRAQCPPDLLSANPITTRRAAVTACRNARAAGAASDKAWRDARIADYKRMPAFR